MQPSEAALTQLREQGYCVVPDVLAADQVRVTRERLLAAADESERRGVSTFMPQLDPNAANVRVFFLLELDALFRDLIRHPTALALVRALLGDGFLISNFTANIARPGSGAMSLHSDQALVVPEPWLQPWSMNVIWCLDDVHADNGATRFLPGSHHYRTLADVPDDAREQLHPFEATAGSVIAMDGRVWHTSGANVTPDEERAMLFGYYSADFLRPQVNWNAALSPEVQAQLDDAMRAWLGLEISANTRTGGEILAQQR